MHMSCLSKFPQQRLFLCECECCVTDSVCHVQVADEIVRRMREETGMAPQDGNAEEKNIRRRSASFSPTHNMTHTHTHVFTIQHTNAHTHTYITIITHMLRSQSDPMMRLAIGVALNLATNHIFTHEIRTLRHPVTQPPSYSTEQNI